MLLFYTEICHDCLIHSHYLLVELVEQLCYISIQLEAIDGVRCFKFVICYLSYVYLTVVGLEPTGNVVGAPARFTVETFGAGKGDVEVTIMNAKGVQEKVVTLFY